MTLIRASRIATTATVEELMKAVRELKATGKLSAEVAVAPAAPAAAPVASAPVAAPAKPPREEPPAPPVAAPAASAPDDPPPPPPRPAKRVSRSDILNDKKLNDVLASLPGAVVSDIREAVK